MTDSQATEERPVLSKYIEAYSKLNLVAYEQERQAREQFAADDRAWLEKELKRLQRRVKWLEDWKNACEDTIARLNRKLLHPDVPDLHLVTCCHKGCKVEMRLPYSNESKTAVSLEHAGNWYFSTDTGWLCPAHAPTRPASHE